MIYVSLTAFFMLVNLRYSFFQSFINYNYYLFDYVSIYYNCFVLYFDMILKLNLVANNERKKENN
jgi:hypothetical protein